MRDRSSWRDIKTPRRSSFSQLGQAGCRARSSAGGRWVGMGRRGGAGAPPELRTTGEDSEDDSKADELWAGRFRSSCCSGCSSFSVDVQRARRIINSGLAQLVRARLRTGMIAHTSGEIISGAPFCMMQLRRLSCFLKICRFTHETRIEDFGMPDLETLCLWVSGMSPKRVVPGFRARPAL